MIFPQLAERLNKDCTPRQRAVVHKLVASRGGIVWNRVGSGKTRIALFIFAALQNAMHKLWEGPSVCLIVCRRKAFRDWRDEINLVLPECLVFKNFVPAIPPDQSPCFLLVSEGMLAKEFASLQKNTQIRVVCYDESWLYANPKSARHEAAYRISRGRVAVALSGTVMKARDLAEVWSQTRIVQKHRILSSSLSGFRGKFQIMSGAGGFPSYSPAKGAYLKVMNSLADVADVYFPASERVITDQVHHVSATVEQQRYFNELKNFYSLDDFDMEFDSALTVILKAQQIANGWVSTPEGTFVYVPTNKVGKLTEEVEDIVAAGQQVVVWCAFRHDVAMLAKRLKFASLQMLGGQEFDVDAWRSGDYPVCLATEASGSSVNHFAQTPYAIYFSTNYKWLDMQQSRGRTDRKSSLHNTCFYKYLQVDGSMDAAVYRAVMASADYEAKLILQANLRDWLKL